MSRVQEAELKNLANILAPLSYQGKDGETREALKNLYVGTPLLEWGNFGGNCTQLGVYDYKGFDIVVTDIHGGKPIEGEQYTLGIYASGECETDNLYTIDSFSFENAVANINSYTNAILASRSINSVVKDWTIIDTSVNSNECTCGAKHTSNPKFHMDWCDKE